MTARGLTAIVTGTGMSVPECVATDALLARCMSTSDEWIEAASEHFGIPPERCLNNIDRYGNTAGASVPVGLHEALSEGRIKDGDLVMLVAFGTGFSWGATLLRW